MRANDILKLGYRMLTGKGGRKRPRPSWLPPREWTDEFIASKAFLSTWQWSKIRYARLQMSDGRCEQCGKGRDDRHDNGALVRLNVDHVWPRLHFPELCLTLEATAVLCDWCNRGKGNSLPR